MVLIIGMTGASGVIYGIRLLEVLSEKTEIETHLIISEAAETNIGYETNWKMEDIKALASFFYDIRDIGARPASGSFKRDGMIVAPCTIKAMAALANSYTENLLVRAGDVTLKGAREASPTSKGNTASYRSFEKHGETNRDGGYYLTAGSLFLS